MSDLVAAEVEVEESGPSGETGDLGASTLSPSGSWQVAPGSGAFNWSDDMPALVPPGGSGSSGPAPIAVRVPDRPLQVALESILERHGYVVSDEPSGFIGELVASPTAATELVPTVLLVDASPVWSQVAMGAVDVGLVDAVVAHQRVDDIPFVLEALLRRDLSSVSCAVRSAARLLPRLSRRQHMLLAFISGEHLKHERVCQALACSATTVKREVRQLREELGLGSRHELPQYARSLGYSPRLTSSDISLLADRRARGRSAREEPVAQGVR